MASHETAAALWGIPTLGRVRATQVTRARRAQGTARYEGVLAHHARLDAAHVTVCDGVPITTPARTVVDLARNRSFRAGVVAADAALRARRCTREELRAVVAACRRWPGLVRARVIGEADGLGKYTSPEVLRREKEREEGIVQLGFTVFRWTWRDAFRRPDALAYRARQVLMRHGYRP